MLVNVCASLIFIVAIIYHYFQSYHLSVQLAYTVLFCYYTVILSVRLSASKR